MTSTALEGDYATWVNIESNELDAYKGQKIPIREAYEWYIQNKISFNKPLLEVFLHRYHIFRMVFNFGLRLTVKSILGQFDLVCVLHPKIRLPLDLQFFTFLFLSFFISVVNSLIIHVLQILIYQFTWRFFYV